MVGLLLEDLVVFQVFVGLVASVLVQIVTKELHEFFFENETRDVATLIYQVDYSVLFLVVTSLDELQQNQDLASFFSELQSIG